MIRLRTSFILLYQLTYLQKFVLAFRKSGKVKKFEVWERNEDVYYIPLILNNSGYITKMTITKHGDIILKQLKTIEIARFCLIRTVHRTNYK